jgi:hypothetical protein
MLGKTELCWADGSLLELLRRRARDLQIVTSAVLWTAAFVAEQLVTRLAMMWLPCGEVCRPGKRLRDGYPPVGDGTRKQADGGVCFTTI